MRSAKRYNINNNLFTLDIWIYKLTTSKLDNTETSCDDTWSNTTRNYKPTGRRVTQRPGLRWGKDSELVQALSYIIREDKRNNI
jgi:hypothetical protein